MKKLNHSWGVEFSKFFEKRGSSDFSSHKNGGVGKIGGVVLENGGRGGVSLNAILKLSSIIFLWVFGVRVFCLFTPFL